MTENGSYRELPVSINRIVVYGSNLAGDSSDYDFVVHLRRSLIEQGISDPDVQLGINVAEIERDFVSPILADKPVNLPRGVIVLPMMRVSDPNNPQLGRVTSTFVGEENSIIPFEVIKKLCEEYGVPYLEMRNGYHPGDKIPLS